jgi:hypothetical protein
LRRRAVEFGLGGRRGDTMPEGLDEGSMSVHLRISHLELYFSVELAGDVPLYLRLSQNLSLREFFGRAGMRSK